MNRRAWRLVPVAGAAWMTAAAATLQPPIAVVFVVAGVGLAVGGAAATWGLRTRGAGLPAIAAVAGLACACVAAHVFVAQPARDAAARFTEGRAVVMTASITGGVTSSPTGEVWFDAIAETTTVGARTVRAAVPVRIGVATDDALSALRADLGARIVVRARSIPADPGDRAALVLRASAPIEVSAPPAGVLGALAVMRDALAASAGRLPGPGAALVPGLATGDTSAVDARLDEEMKAASLSHLTAVSGANCAIVLGMAFGIAALCGCGRRIRVLVGLGALGLFVLLVTPEPSVVRAAVMAAVAMSALLLGRRGAGLATLALAVVVLLVADPWLSSSLGFALSVAATGALLVLARPLAAGLARIMPATLAFVIAVPLSAQLVCAPLIVLIDPRVPLLGVVANLLTAPAAPPATIAGFLACLAAPLPVLQDGLVGLAWVPATWIAGVAAAVSAVPAQQIPWLEGWPGAVLAALLSAVVAVTVAVPRSRNAAVRLARATAVITTALVIGVTAAHTTLSTIAGGWTVPADSWRIAMCDVGQGDAVLVRSAGVVALFDTGPEPAPLTRCLDRFGVSRVDLLVLTHFDLDHVGGVAAVTGRTGTVLHGPVGAGDDAVLGRLTAAGAQAVAVSAGDRGELGQARWRVLWPVSSVTEAGNDASVVVEITGADLPRTVLLGDLSAEPQARLRASVPDSEVVKVAHHGSADQDGRLYDALSAEVALVPVGAENDYGHPRASTLSLLRADGSTIARTDQDGAVALWREDGVLRLWREHGVGGAQ